MCLTQRVGVTHIRAVVLLPPLSAQVSHGANGLSQERAYVTGLTAANLVVDKLGVGKKAIVLDVEPDEPHVVALKQLDQGVRGVFDSLGIKSPLL